MIFTIRYAVRTKKIIFFIFLINIFLFASSCHPQIKFDKDRWLQKDAGIPSSDREKMLTDITTNFKLVGMKYSQIIDLLGNPDYTDSMSHSLSYSIIVDYGYDIDPVYLKYLDFSISKDSVITSWKVQ